jgi:hypothetical protein
MQKSYAQDIHRLGQIGEKLPLSGNAQKLKKHL